MVARDLTDRFNGVQSSLAVKAPCIAAAIAAITLSGEQTVGSVVVVSGDRVLVAGQTDSTENGIYDASSSAWTRAADWDGNRDVVNGTLVTVATATVGRNPYYQAIAVNPVVIGSSQVSFALADGPNVSYALTPGEEAVGVTDDDIIDSYESGYVLRYGAIADNATDSLAAFDMAQLVAGQTGAGGTIGVPIRIPAGKYVLSGDWVVDEARAIIGDGKYLSLLKFQTGSTNGLHVTKLDCDVRGIGVCNSYGNGIKADEIHRANFVDILVSPFTLGYGFWNHACFELMLENYRCTTNGTQPWLDSEDDVFSTDSAGQHGIFANPAAPSLNGTSASIYRSCIVSGLWGSGFYSIGTLAGGNPTRSYGKIDGCTFEGNGNNAANGAQIYLQTVNNMEITGTHTEAANNIHLHMVDCIRCIIIGHTKSLVMTGTESGNNANCADNIFIGGDIASEGTATAYIDSSVYRTKFFGTIIQTTFRNESRTTEFLGCPNSRVNQFINVKGSCGSQSNYVLNDNVNFSRWPTATAPEGYSSLGGATFSKVTHATAGFHGTISCRVTAIGSNPEEGISVSIDEDRVAREEYVGVSCQLRKTSAFAGQTIEVSATFDATKRAIQITADDYDDDVWFPVSTGFGNLAGDGNARDITVSIAMDDSPDAALFFDIDAFEVSRGEGTYTHGNPNQNDMVNLYLNDVRVTNAASIPVAGNYIQGDFVGNTAPSIDGNNMILLGWSRLVTGGAHVANTDWGLCYVSSVTPAT